MWMSRMVKEMRGRRKRRNGKRLVGESGNKNVNKIKFSKN